MPELPEVEKVRRDLEAGWGEDTLVAGLKFFRKDLRYPMPPAARCRKLKGERPLRIERIGKFLILHFPTKRVISHLGMSGAWRWEKTPKEQRRKHDHIHLNLSDGRTLVYNDPRRFGFFEILTLKEFEKYPSLRAMGPDPLTPLRAEDFAEKYKHSVRSIKTLLMDQRVLAGVGNIYACEALFLAGVSPERLGKDLGGKDWDQILKQLRKVLRRAIRHGGTTLRDYSHADGGKGSFQNRLKVYGRTGKPCPTCGQPIVGKVLGGRSTYWCSECQS